MANKKREPVKKEPLSPMVSRPLLKDLRRMIEDTRQGVAVAVNGALSMLYWKGRDLAYLVRFSEPFPDETILHTLCTKLSWSHFRLLVRHVGQRHVVSMLTC